MGLPIDRRAPEGQIRVVGYRAAVEWHSARLAKSMKRGNEATMKCSYLVIVGASVVLSSHPLCAPRQFLKENNLDTMPIDLAVTPSGEVGAVRATSDSDPTLRKLDHLLQSPDR